LTGDYLKKGRLVTDSMHDYILFDKMKLDFPRIGVTQRVLTLFDEFPILCSTAERFARFLKNNVVGRQNIVIGTYFNLDHVSDYYENYFKVKNNGALFENPEYCKFRKRFYSKLSTDMLIRLADSYGITAMLFNIKTLHDKNVIKEFRI
jgi:hypothetical protein